MDTINRRDRREADQANLRSEVAALKKKIEEYELKVKYFILGFSALTVLGFGLGVFFKEQIRYPLIEMIYPTERVVEQATMVLAIDDNQRQRFRDSLIPKVDYEKVGIESFPKIKGELPPRVWESIQNGDVDQFKKFVAKPAFFESLREHYEGDLARLFSSAVEFNNHTEFDLRLRTAGQKKDFVHIKILAQGFQSASTACGYKIDHDKMQATIALPKSIRPYDYWWFDCKPHYPKISLLLELSNSMKVGDIQLVGVEETNAQNIEVRLTREAAMRLKIPGAEQYSGLTTGSVVIDGVWR